MLKLMLPLIVILMSSMLNLQWWQSMISLILLSFMFIMMFNYTQTSTILTQWTSMDFMSSSLILLSILIAAMMIMASSKIFMTKLYTNLFMLLNIILLMVLIMAFSSSSLMYFYIWFEASLIPTLMIILFWGYQPERVQAGMYLMLYTIMASLPMLMMFMLIQDYSTSMNMFTFTMYMPQYMNNKIFWLMMISGMLVKLPMFTTHLWLPKAHVEAPIAGSMVLAAILLKLGGYGLLRVMMLFNKSNLPFKFLMSLSIYGAFLTSLICLRQPDMKSMIAYSSVGHMGIMITGSMSTTKWGYMGTLMMMIAHGLCSSALFILANTTYLMTHTRSMFLTKGILLISPSLTMWWFLFLSINMAAPPSFNLMSEIILMTSIMSSSMMSFIPLGLLSFFTTVYSLNLFSITQHGHLPSSMNPLSSYKPSDMLLMITHIIPLILMTLKPNMFILW